MKNHPWFGSVNWEAVLGKQYRSPFVPILKSSADVSYFDSEFTEAPVETYAESIAASKPAIPLYSKPVIRCRGLHVQRTDRREGRARGRTKDQLTSLQYYRRELWWGYFGAVDGSLQKIISVGVGGEQTDESIVRENHIVRSLISR